MSFKVNERVVVYHGGDRNIGEICQIYDQGTILVDTAEAGRIVAHPKQCRRLVKKIRRKLWIAKSDFRISRGTITPLYEEPMLKKLWIEFVECKK